MKAAQLMSPQFFHKAASASEMTYIVSGGALKSTHSLTPQSGSKSFKK